MRLTSEMEAVRPGSEPVRSYRTTFMVDEEPLSEGGFWLNGRKDGIDWCDVLVRDGLAYGEITRMTSIERRAEQATLGAGGDEAAPTGDYDDPTAVLAGEWGPTQLASALVHSVNPTNEFFQEVEIRLRSSMTPNSCTGYEVFFRCLTTDEGYAEIVRWNGPIGSFTSLRKLIGSEYGVKDGDVIQASMVGTSIKGYINGREVISAEDDRFMDGAPGIGFNFYVGDTNVDHGLRSFEVDSYR